MARLSMRGSGDLSKVEFQLTEYIQNSAISCELIDQVSHTVGTAEVRMYVFEKYYMRSSNRASLTVMLLADENDEIFVDAVGAGGGQGAIFRFSWGAEEDFVGTVKNALEPLGFREIAG